MKKVCFWAVFGAFFIAPLKAQDVTAGFSTEPITIDGKAVEWSVPFRFSDYTSKIQYNIRNDSATLYFCFKTDDRLSQLKLLYYGFDIYIDTTGKKKKTVHLQFPMKNGELEKGERAIAESGYDLQLYVKSEITALFAQNFIGLPNGIQPLKTDGGIEAAIDFDEAGALVFEIAIPVKMLQTNVNSEKKPWYVTFRMNAPRAQNLNIGTGGESMNRNRDGRGGMGLGAGSVSNSDIDGGVDGTGGTGGLGGGMGGLGANTQAGLYGNAYGMGYGGMNNNATVQRMPQIGNSSKAFEHSEWKFKFRLAK